MYFVYILRSVKTGEYYKGLTDNFERRLHEHEIGKSLTTKWRLPLEIVHVELCEMRKEARKLEKYFKSGAGREIIEELFSLGGGIGRRAALKKL
jgi:putative endonuclease